MKLQRVEVKNYRSIDDTVALTFKETENGCYFMFGINETGKSNILKACALLDKEHRSKFNWVKDCFKENRRNNQITEVDYYFDLESKELLELKSILTDIIPEEILNEINGVWHWIEGKIDSTTRTGFGLVLNDESKLQGYVKKIKKVVPAVKPVTTTPPVEVVDVVEPAIESSFVLFKASDINVEEKDNYINVDPEDIANIVVGEVEDDFFEKRLPKVIFWDSSNRNLIHGTTDLNVFKDDPTKYSVPLFNMFKLININKDSLSAQIVQSLKEPTDRHKLATDLSQATTKHLNKIWKEHEVEAQVQIDASGACDVHFTDKDANTNFFEMEDRSDGFQRFISFILTLSAENINEELQNSLVLLDEPEVHLHPSGIEYLKDELLNISKNNNYILAASHSIFLVDRKCLERHITVRKITGKTSIDYVSIDNPFQEEVIFRALNTSIYELVQPLSIIFEGRIDSDIFLAVKYKFRTELASLISVGGISATGATEVKKYEKFFKGNLMVQAMAVLDSDTEGRKELAVIRAGAHFNNNAFELKDIYDIGKVEFETEDLLPLSLVTDVAKKLYKYDFNIGIDNTKPILDEIKRIKHAQGIIDDKKLEELKNKIVEAVLRDTDSKILSKVDFKVKYDTYYKFIEALQIKVRSISRNP